MKQYILQEQHQGFDKGQIFEGPKIIPGTIKNGYYPLNAGPESKFCFYESYIIGNPELFLEITKTPTDVAGV